MIFLKNHVYVKCLIAEKLIIILQQNRSLYIYIKKNNNRTKSTRVYINKSRNFMYKQNVVL